jgi:hypothetical protein
MVRMKARIPKVMVGIWSVRARGGGAAEEA